MRATTVTPVTIAPVQFKNVHRGHVYGVEAWADYAPAYWWRLSAGLNTFHKNIRLKPGHIATNIDQSLGNDPGYQISLRSSFEVTADVDFDVGIRIIDDLKNPVVPAHEALDARLAYRLSEHVELALTGLNLLEARHAETGLPTNRGEIPRSFVASIRCAF